MNNLEALADAKIELLKKQAWDDLYIFTKYVCGRNLMEEQPHREVCEFLTVGLDKSKQLNLRFTPPETNDFVKNSKKCLKKLLMLPRGAFKSTIASNAFVVWLLWHNPDLRIMIDSETLSNAKMYLSGVKDMIENNKIIRLICTNSKGEYILEPNKGIAGGFTEEQVILKRRRKVGMKEPSIFCSGADNARTGMHPDVIIGDDLVSERNVGTDQQIEKVKDHYRFSLSLLEPDGLLVIIGTRYHLADLYGWLLEVESFDKLVRPALDEQGDLFFPTRLTHEFLHEQRMSQGSYIFNCQYLLSPIDDSNSLFKESDFEYYTAETLPKSFVEKHILVDLAISEKETADFTVVLAVGVTERKDIYVLDYTRGHFNPFQTVEAIFNMCDAHKAGLRSVGIESVAFQKAMLYLVKDEMKRRGLYYPLKELKADRDKKRRIGALQPLFQNHQVFIRHGHTELKKELLEFPFSKHDDIIDALAYVLQVLRIGNYYSERKYDYNYKRRYSNIAY